MTEPRAGNADVGRAITLLRVVRGWNQDDLAKAAGLRNSSISEYERGRKTPSLTTLERILGAMGFPLSAIDHTRLYVASLKAGTYLAVPPDPSPSIQGPPPVGRSALDWEIDQAAEQVGRAAARYFRIALHVLAGRPAPDQDLAPDQEP